MKKFYHIFSLILCLSLACGGAACAGADRNTVAGGAPFEEQFTPAGETEAVPAEEIDEGWQTEGNEPLEAEQETPEEEPETPEEEPETPNEPCAAEAQPLRAEYIRVCADGVNIRRGAGTEYSVCGVAQRDTLYIACGKTGGWYKTAYKGKEAYICADYCTPVHMDLCKNEQVERVIEEGCRLLGCEYVYGATRYMDGGGNLIKGFDERYFDCSSLMQYIFKRGAGINLNVTTRTQVTQGRAVGDGLKRGDLMFFTNASRVNKTGVERVGHVALYLGDGYILHTASDFAKIEKLSPLRLSYFLQARRVIE